MFNKIKLEQLGDTTNCKTKKNTIVVVYLEIIILERRLSRNVKMKNLPSLGLGLIL